MRVLVTGAGGMLGRDVVSAAGAANHQLTALDRTDLDVTDAEAVQKAVVEEKPEAVINCAGFTDLDAAEEAETGAGAVNAQAAGVIAEAAAAIEARVVYVSTDYVFDGEKGAAYVESDQPAPLSAYGRTKLAGEQLTALGNRRHFIVRSSWLFGTGGPNFVETMLQLAEDHGEVVVVRDQIGSPTYTGHLASGIVRLIEGTSYGIHHMAADGACSWWDFAREIFDQAEIECHVMSATSDILTERAPRPKFAALDSQRRHAIALPPWREGLAAYLAERRTLEGALT